MKRTKRIALLGMSLKSRNLGVQAITYSFLELIAEVAKGKFKPIFYMINFEEKYKEEKTTINDEVFTIKYLYPSMLSSPKDALKSLVKDLRPNHLLDFFRKCSVDIVFCIGAGDSFSDIYGAFRYKIVNAPISFFRLINKPYIFLPQTIGPFNRPQIKKTAQKTLEKAKVIMVRDKQSYEVTQDLVPNKTIESYIDIAFFLKYEKMVFSHEKTNIGINVSALLWNSPGESYSLKDNYQKLIRSIIDYFIEVKDVTVYLTAHVPGEEKTLENDYYVAKEIANDYHDYSVVLSPFFKTAREAKDFISGLDFFTGARMHACIAAFSSNVPVVPMAYSRKFNGLFLDTLNYKKTYFADLRENTNEEVLDIIKHSFHNKDSIRKEISTVNKNIIERNREKIIDSLKAIIN